MKKAMVLLAAFLFLVIGAQCRPTTLAAKTLSVTYTTVDLGAPIYSTPVLYDHDNDGVPDITVALNNGTIVILNGSGAILDVATLSGSVMTTPIIMDLDKDDIPEILVGSLDYNLYCLSFDKLTVEWVYGPSGVGDANPITVDLAVGDVDGDSVPEIVFARFGVLHVTTYFLANQSQDKWNASFSQKIGAISLYDLTGDGVPEILFGLSNGSVMAYFGNGTMMLDIPTGGKVETQVTVDPQHKIIYAVNDNGVYAYSVSGVSLWNDTTDPGVGSAAVADIDQDGEYDIIYTINGTGNSRLVMKKYNGVTIASYDDLSFYPLRTTPLVADVNNDTTPEVVVATNISCIIDNGGHVLYSLPLISATHSSPVMGNVDDDPNSEIVLGIDTGRVYIFKSAKFLGTPAMELRGGPERQAVLTDTDHDGVPNYMENVYGTNVSSVDTDGDGLSDLQELKVLGTNPSSTDTDHDGMPDKWEVDNNLNPTTNDAGEDPDNDGVVNVNEYTNGTNPHKADTDEDGMPDEWEIKYSLNPLSNDASEDPDNDGLTNLQEYKHDTNPIVADTDGDGYNDGAEIASGTDPLNAMDNMTIRGVVLGGVAVAVAAVAIFLVIKRKSK